jgi:hypothetical protein
VVFTRGSFEPVEALHQIRSALANWDPTLRLDLVRCTRVPVLVVWTADGELSLDLSVDQQLPEQHVLWFRRQRELSDLPPPRQTVGLSHLPTPPALERDLGFEAVLLRCVKWWLRRRKMPSMKEGGYPSLVWTLMALHALRCSASDDSDEGHPGSRGRRLLSALAAFFDRFAGHDGLSGTILFQEDARSEFRRVPLKDPCAGGGDASSSMRPSWPEFSLLDPTATGSDGEAPTDLAPRTSPATQLLHAYELQRARRLSAAALRPSAYARDDPGAALGDGQGARALRELFEEPDIVSNYLPAVLEDDGPTGILLLRGDHLELGILRQIVPRPGWDAPFLHRRDVHSCLHVHLCNVSETGVVEPRPEAEAAEARRTPCDFVSLAALREWRPPPGATGAGAFALEPDDLDRWREMRALLREMRGDAIVLDTQPQPSVPQEALSAAADQPLAPLATAASSSSPPLPAKPQRTARRRNRGARGYDVRATVAAGWQ